MKIDTQGRTITERLGQARLQSRDISELIGICKGVLADGVINLQEAMFIAQWLENHQSVLDVWPANFLYQTLDNVLEDGKLSGVEEGELLDVLVAITGVPVRMEISIVSNGDSNVSKIERTLNTSTTLPFNEPENGIQFSGSNIVLTGTFLKGSRKECEEIVRLCGANTQKNVIGSTRYLIVGEIGTESWAHSSFGRKIEKAVALKDAGQEIYIVSEEYWIGQLNKETVENIESGQS